MSWNEPDNNDNKDPWGNGKKQDGPPDLDEAIKKMQRKLSLLLGGKASADGSNKGSSFSLAVIGVIALVLWGLSGIFIVGPAEEGVVLRFGQYKETVTPGPHWIPRFIDSRYIINVQKVSNFSYTALMLTKDENIVSVSVAVQYRVNNLKDYLFNLVNPSESLQQATASSLRQVIGHTTLDDILTTGRAVVRQDVEKQVAEILNFYQSGLEITDVAMQPAKAPEEVKGAFDDAIKAQEDEQRFINQAEAYSRGVEPIAEGGAKRILQEAQAYRQESILIAKGDVSRFLALLPQYKRAPEVTRERLYLETVEAVLEKSSKVLVDVKGGNNMMYLPLDRLMDKSHSNNLDFTNVASNAANSRMSMAQLNQTSNSGRTTRDAYQGRE